MESLKEKHDYLAVPDLEINVRRHENPHYRLHQKILQVKQFQYKFFQNINLYEHIFPQFKIFSIFTLRFFRFNYQLL